MRLAPLDGSGTVIPAHKPAGSGVERDVATEVEATGRRGTNGAAYGFKGRELKTRSVTWGLEHKHSKERSRGKNKSRSVPGTR